MGSAVCTLGINHLNNRIANWPRLSMRWINVHPQTWTCIDFDDGRMLACKWLRYVESNNIDPCDIETDHSRCLDGLSSNIGMNVVGDIGRSSACAQLCIAANGVILTFGGDRLQGVPLFTNDCQPNPRDLAKNRCMSIATSWILVDKID